MLVARVIKAETVTLLPLNSPGWPSRDVDQFSSAETLCLGAACLTYRLGGGLFFSLLHLPVSHYDVPQQGLLGELILIQQQIQRHEEEVRRAAAANNARPPPPEPAPILPQQTRKVKVTTHLDLPYCTKISLMTTAAEDKQTTFSKSP